jgi:hypothetical protein
MREQLGPDMYGRVRAALEQTPAGNRGTREASSPTEGRASSAAGRPRPPRPQAPWRWPVSQHCLPATERPLPSLPASLTARMVLPALCSPWSPSCPLTGCSKSTEGRGAAGGRDPA